MHPLYLILGSTAGGKGAVGREIARRVGGQIVSVDSMKVYRRMDIGTAKPSREARAEVPHWCIDVVEPSESYSVARFLACAEDAVQRIRADGALPLGVGGTNLYIQALRKGLFQAPAPPEELRRELQARARDEGAPALHGELAQVDPAAADRIHPNDAKRVVRALEVYRATGTPITELQKQWDQAPPKRDLVMIGLRRGKDDRNARVNARTKRMMDMGLRDEVAGLLARSGGLSRQASQAVGYAEMIDHLQGRCSLDEAFERIKINTRRLARKQRTWQRRWREVRWFDCAPDEPVGRIADRIEAEVTFA
jgi:tRNA dimethylallyltransferase